MDIADLSDVRIEYARECGVLASLRPATPLIVCYDCLAPIERDRLAVLPHAIRCIACQSVYERTR